MDKVTYEIFENEFGINTLTRTDLDGKVWFIPQDISNSDYVAYLAWLETQEEDQ
jgi:hypothetical protein